MEALTEKALYSTTTTTVEPKIPRESGRRRGEQRGVLQQRERDPQSLFRGRTDGTHYEQTLECFYCYYVDPDDASRNHDHDDQHGAHCCDAA